MLLALQEAAAATRLAGDQWDALLAAALPSRFPVGLPAPFAPHGGGAGLDLAGVRLRAFGNVLGAFDATRPVLTGLRGPGWAVRLGSEVDAAGAWRDRFDLEEAPTGLRGWLTAASRHEGTTCPPAWRGAPGVEAPIACLGRLTSLRLDAEARPGGRSADALRIRAESREGASTVAVGPVRLPDAWQVRLSLPDLNAEAAVSLQAAGDPAAAVRQVEGTLTAVTARGTERLRVSWNPGGDLVLESRTGALRFVLGGELPWRIESTQDNSLQGRIERFERDEAARAWIAQVTRRDGARRTWVLAPLDWQALPDSPARGDGLEPGAAEGWPSPGGGPGKPESGLNLSASLP